MRPTKRLDEFIAGMLEEPTPPGLDAPDDDSDVRQVAIEYVGTYLALKAQIEDLEELADAVRQDVLQALNVAAEKPGKRWVFEGLGVVSIVKGRVSEKLDRGRLARAGVSGEVIDAATVRSESGASVRIAAWTGAEEAQGRQKMGEGA